MEHRIKQIAEQARLASRGRPPADWATMLLVGDGAMTVALQETPNQKWSGWRWALTMSGTFTILVYVLFAYRVYRGRKDPRD